MQELEYHPLHLIQAHRVPCPVIELGRPGLSWAAICCAFRFPRHTTLLYHKRWDTVGEITTRRQKPLVLRIMVEQGRTMVLFLSELVSRCEQIFPHRCCSRPSVSPIRQQISRA